MRYVDWFYRQCSRRARAHAGGRRGARATRGFDGRVGVWGRGVDADLFTARRAGTSALRTRLLAGGDAAALVGRPRLGREADRACCSTRSAGSATQLPGLRLAVVGDGPGAGRARGGGARTASRSSASFTGDELARALRERRPLLLPEHDRHVRPGAAGSRRIGAAGGRRRRRRRARARRARRDRAARAARTTARRSRRRSRELVPSRRAASPARGGRRGPAAPSTRWDRSLAELRDAYRRVAGIGDARTPRRRHGRLTKSATWTDGSAAC